MVCRRPDQSVVTFGRNLFSSQTWVQYLNLNKSLSRISFQNPVPPLLCGDFFNLHCSAIKEVKAQKLDEKHIKNIKNVPGVDVGMADQVKSPKSIDTRSQQSTADTTVANTWRLSHPYLITYYTVRSIEMP